MNIMKNQIFYNHDYNEAVSMWLNLIYRKKKTKTFAHDCLVNWLNMLAEHVKSIKGRVIWKKHIIQTMAKLLKVTCINTYDFIPLAKKYPQRSSANTTHIILHFLVMPLVHN